MAITILLSDEELSQLAAEKDVARKRNACWTGSEERTYIFCEEDHFLDGASQIFFKHPSKHRSFTFTFLNRFHIICMLNASLRGSFLNHTYTIIIRYTFLSFFHRLVPDSLVY